MAYKIQYSPETAKRYPQFRSKKKGKAGKWVVLMMVFAAALWMRINGVPDFLIPGDPEITKTAAAMLMNDIQGGVPVGDAVTTFCEEIIHGAGF